MSPSVYPVHVSARPDAQLSRWLWLVKWLLLIPHLIVLAFLGVAFGVLSLVAFFAILFTAHYPRAIFDFNVGVMRWSWRVSYYGYSALGTDRYPPFTLAERADYPAHLEVDYPERLSRGLVLVKWWLLALPHYVVLVAFFGGASYVAGSWDDSPGLTIIGSSGLIGVLVLVAAVVLLFTGRYPRSIYDFVLGMNRWGLRVLAYTALMTDAYPPFRLDQGPDDPTPDPVPAGASPGASAAAPATATARTGGDWGPGRVVGVVLASLVVMSSLGALASGAALLVVDLAVRDDAGFVMSDDERLDTATYALTTPSVEVQSDAVDDVFPEQWLGDVRVSVRPDQAGGGDVFLGIARTADVERYLGDVRHARLVGLDDGPQYEVSGTGTPATIPDQQDIWVEEATGSGEQTLTWKIRDGDWTLVVMNADAEPGVAVEAATGAELPALTWAATALLVLGGIGLVVAGVALAFLLRSRKPRPTPGVSAAA